jgi:hypothetical protein
MEERRSSHRYNLPLSVIVRPLARDSSVEFRVTTRDVSTGGLYFTSKQRLDVGHKLDLAVTLPPEATAGSSITIDVQGHVLRVDDAPDGASERCGVAVVIDKLNVSRAAVDFALHRAEEAALSRRNAATV